MTNRSLTKITKFVALSAALMVSSGLHAQLHWNVTHVGSDSASDYAFTSISSFNETCTAAGLKTDITRTGEGRIKIMFFRSNDAGLTWEEQDPGLPPESYQYQNEISQIQQIDSLNAVGVGDTGLIVRTTDGGQTWIQQNIGVKSDIANVHFSDSATGIAVFVNESVGIVTTHDAGNHWTIAPFAPSFAATRCHSDGGSKFRVVSFIQGPVYTTYDNWQSVDSTPLIYGTPQHPDTPDVVTGCNFEGADTLVAYGYNFEEGNRLLITVSTDSGENWNPFTIPDSAKITPSCMSALDRDFILLGGVTFAGHDQIGFSSDHGMTWEADSIITNYSDYFNLVLGVTVTPQDHAVAIFTDNFRGNGGVLARGDFASVVNPLPIVANNFEIYPNPSFNLIHVSTESESFSISDPLGRSYVVLQKWRSTGYFFASLRRVFCKRWCKPGEICEGIETRLRAFRSNA